MTLETGTGNTARMARRLSKLSTDALDDMVSASAGDRSTLQDVLDELGHRTSGAARRLALRVHHAISAHTGQPKSGKQTPSILGGQSIPRREQVPEPVRFSDESAKQILQRQRDLRDAITSAETKRGELLHEQQLASPS